MTELQRTIRDLYLAGVKCKDIAETVNVSEKNICKRRYTVSDGFRIALIVLN